MRTTNKFGRAFTLIELLVVIAIIAILAALLLPALSRAKIQGQVTRAKMQMGQIVNAIQSYDAEYSRMPVSKADMETAAGKDLTFGAVLNTPGGGTVKVGLQSLDVPVIPHTNVIAITMDLEVFGNGDETINKAHVLNPKRNAFLNAASVGDALSPGVGTDGIYRDSWKNPYIITLDMNQDGRVRDSFYSLAAVSQKDPLNEPKTGHFGLVNPTGVGDQFEVNGPIMVWSAGPDGMVDPNTKANAGVNKDNVLSWKQ